MASLPSLAELQARIESDYERNTQRAMRLATAALTAIERLAQVGIALPDANNVLRYCSTIHVNMAQLTAVRRALGCLKATYSRPVNGERNMVEVTMRAVDPEFHHLAFVFKRKLPRGSKCKIVSHRVVERSLVCGK